MNKSTIKRMLKSHVKGAEVICRNEIRTCMGWGNNLTDTVIKGLDGIRVSHTKYYSIDEVAGAIAAYIE